MDLTVLGVAARTLHVEACLDMPTSTSTGAAARLTAVLERLDDCPVCGAAWTGPREAHVKACAAQHSLTAKELSSLVDMFRESLDSPHASSASVCTSCRGPARSECPGGALSIEIAEDDVFQSARVRVPLRQAAISVRRISKKQQEVLDELDDDLCEAKALSLSLTRGPAPPLRMSRERPKAAAGQLERSDILACGEAQSYIRQRSVALERMDEENAARAGTAPSRRSARPPPAESRATLWALGAQESATLHMYRAIIDADR
ncbi:hypothetical protein H4R19_003618 [Coemansia spiralis]|nr:hypothetical protein H4R19_003618 [Coemansia spiralis]